MTGDAEQVQVVEHGLLAAAVAEVTDFAEQLCGVGAALVPAPMQVGRERIEQEDTAPGAVVDQRFLDVGGAGEAPDSSAGKAELCAGRHAFGVGAGPVPAHDLDSGMRTQPVGESFCGPVAEDLDRAARFDIDQDRCVPMPSAEGEVVDTEHPRCDRLRIR